MRATLLATTLVTLCLLTACGQKGALYHPADKTTNTPAQSTPTTDTTDRGVISDTDY